MYGHAAYGCALCCGYATTGYGFWYDPLGIPDLGTADQGVQALNECDGGDLEDVSDSFYGNWTTGNTSIATVDHYGTHTGVAIGSTTSKTNGELNSNDVGRDCPLKGYNPSGNCNTTASVTVSGPAYVPLRASGSTGPNSMTLTASGEPSGGTYTWSTTSSNVTLAPSAANVTVTAAAASATQGDTPITVKYVINNDTNCTNANDCSTATVSITVSKPTKLQLITDDPDPTGHTCNASAQSNSCTQSAFTGSGSYTSYVRNRSYHVMDQLTPPNWISGYAMVIQESYSPPSGQCASNTVITGSGNGDTVTDCFYFCSATCQSGGSCSVAATQTITVNGFQVATESVGWSCSSASVVP